MPDSFGDSEGEPSVFFFSNYVKPTEEPLLKWIVDNQDLIRQGAAAYEGQVVTPQSTLVRYDCVMSFILYTGRTCSPLMLMDSEKAKSTFIRMTGLTLCLGWWALFGIVYTPQALWTNFSGGDKKTVSEILDLAKTLGPSEDPTTATTSASAATAAKKSSGLGVLPVVPLFMLGVVALAFVVVGIAIVAKKIIGH